MLCKPLAQRSDIINQNPERHTNCTQNNLCCHAARKISPGMRQLFSHVGDSIRCPNGVCAVEHVNKKSNAATPSSIVVPILPHRGITGMLLWHSSNDDDGHYAANNKDKQPHIL